MQNLWIRNLTIKWDYQANPNFPETFELIERKINMNHLSPTKYLTKVAEGYESLKNAGDGASK